jgi:hypothetical protein
MFTASARDGSFALRQEGGHFTEVLGWWTAVWTPGRINSCSDDTFEGSNRSGR